MTYVFAFLTSAAIAGSFRSPRRAVASAGIAGLMGWFGYQTVLSTGAPIMLAAFSGGLLVGAASEVMARRLREPVVLFVIPGLFPLVPGMMVYAGMLHLAREELPQAAQILARTTFYAGALAAGLALPPAIFRRSRRR